MRSRLLGALEAWNGVCRANIRLMLGITFLTMPRLSGAAPNSEKGARWLLFKSSDEVLSRQADAPSCEGGNGSVNSSCMAFISVDLRIGCLRLSQSFPGGPGPAVAIRGSRGVRTVCPRSDAKRRRAAESQGDPPSSSLGHRGTGVDRCRVTLGADTKRVTLWNTTCSSL